MSSPRYFGGASNDLGNVTALPHDSFTALVTEHITLERRLPVTAEAFHALPKRERDQMKRQTYITAAAFRQSPSPRKTAEATHCNLIALDIDDNAEAARLLQQDWSSLLPGVPYLVWHTISSTPQAPRLRVLVSAEQIPAARYGEAVRTIGGRLGLTTITHESLVAVQPMFLPTGFSEQMQPIVYQRLDGDPFLLADILGDTDLEVASANHAAASAPTNDIEYLRTPVEGITPQDVEDALEHLDPDCAMQQWIEIAASLKHQFGEAGFDLWDKWSSKGSKYEGTEETQYRWGTLKAHPVGRAPITIRSLFKLAAARGWENPALTHRLHNQITEWLRNGARSTEQLLDEGLKRIAKAGATLSALEKKSLIATYKEVMGERNMTVSLTDVRAELRKLEIDSAKTTGLPAWTTGICYVTSSNQFYRYTTNRMFTPEVIDLMHATPAVGDEKPPRPRDYLIQVAGVPQVEALRYDPTQGDKRFFTDGGVPYVNTYIPSYPKPDRSRAAEAGDVILRHVETTIAEPLYREIYLSYYAHLVQKPGKKIRWAMLLQGAQGSGKSFWAVLSMAMLGRNNVRKVAASDVINGQFNGWAVGQQVVFLEEIRVVGSSRHLVMDRMKPCISDEYISVRELYQPARMVPNNCNYVMFTNYHDALAINDSDRRYFVLESQLQTPEQIAALGKDYFTTLFQMVHENPAGVRAWFEDYKLSPEFNADGRAPITRYLHNVAANAASPLASAILQVIEDGSHPLVQGDVLSLSALRVLVSEMNVGPFSDQGLALVLLEHGWTKGPRTQIDGMKHSLWLKNYRGEEDLHAMVKHRLEIL